MSSSLLDFQERPKIRFRPVTLFLTLGPSPRINNSIERVYDGVFVTKRKPRRVYSRGDRRRDEPDDNRPGRRKRADN